MRNTLYNLIISRLASFVKVFFVFFANIYDVFLHSCNAQTSFCPFVVIYVYKKENIPQTVGDFVRRGGRRVVEGVDPYKRTLLCAEGG